MFYKIYMMIPCIILLNNPMMIMVLLLIMTLNIIFLINMTMINQWFCYLIFLVLIGGLLIMFMYMISLIPSEKMNYNFIIYMISVIMMFILYQKMMKLEQNIIISNSPEEMYTYFPMITFLILFLLFTMFSVTALVNESSGPIRLL